MARTIKAFKAKTVSLFLQIANKDGTDHNRGTIDVTLFDPSGVQILSRKDTQTGEIEQKSHGTRVRHKQCRAVLQVQCCCQCG